LDTDVTVIYNLLLAGSAAELLTVLLEGMPIRRVRLLVAVVAAIALLTGACTHDDTGGGGDARKPDTAENGRPGGKWFDIACNVPLHTLRIIDRGTVVGRSPDIIFLPKRPHFAGGFNYTSHSGSDDYLQEVPLTFYGPGFIRRQGTIELARQVTVADIAPTIAELIDFPLPKDRQGTVVKEALRPPEERPGKPALVIVVAWDGGGLNVLDRWPHAWPNLDRLGQLGTEVAGAIVGSSPSTTPAVHATIGTGVFPSRHKTVDTYMRVGDEIEEAWADVSPKQLRVTTLADLYDRASDNEPKVGLVAKHGWHLGMLGHGAATPGGDHDVAVLISNSGETATNPSFYSLPPSAVDVPGLDDAIRSVDADDGAIDSQWMDHELTGIAKGTPVWTKHQSDITKSVLTGEGFGQDDIPDLFFTNYKELDLVGHEYNMVNPEVRSVLMYTDAELAVLEAYLNQSVGRNRWVMIVTADHGQQPEASAIDAWPISVMAMAADLTAHLDLERGELVQQTRVTGLWLDRGALKSAGGSLGEAAEFLLDYTIEDNAQGDIPAEYRSRRKENLLEAVLPTRRLEDVIACAKESGGK
jgi:hypothetical protein